MDAYRKMMRAKIHRATVTHADVHYEGSVTIPPELLEATAIMPYEAVCIWNVTNGARFETYAIEGEPESTHICVNGAAARLVSPGDIVIIACFTWLHQRELSSFRPRVVFVDENNRIRESRSEIPGPKLVAV
ncbi:MAG: aspartate 1-decarboxylase [Oligoflexia bacterium]|nr:aspartate 1-decarboxylase [Oligoflexia bacterium]